ncbi:hypothetical protein ACFVT5_01785 [Streptomyces sp. NPDC058001]|uniref:hypothetical protein n=1 Tax=Streptomyces sp. NPDC058001 TaxID=3346300 RepID=UPI0036E63B92
MSTRRRMVVVWAALCLAGIAATSALTAEPDTDKPKSPTEEPTATRPVDCEEIADRLEQGRAEGERARQEALNPTATPTHRGTLTVTDMAVQEECIDVLKDRGLTKR